MSEAVTICEVGMRDGLQMVRAIMPSVAKLACIRALHAAGLGAIEAGSFVPHTLVPQMADSARVVEECLAIPGLVVVALAPNLRGAQAAHAAGAHRITFPLSASAGHSMANTRKTPADQLAVLREVVAWVRAQPRAMEVEAVLATAFGCSIDGPVDERVVARLAEGMCEAGADRLTLADTAGYANPAQVRRIVRDVGRITGARPGKPHLHDTMGVGLANVVAGLEEGVRAFDSSIGGIGGCPFAPGAWGNIATEDLAYLLNSMGFDTGIDLDRLLDARATVQSHLPGEPLFGRIANMGVPKTYRARTM